MRVVAGTARGIRLIAPAGKATRPTSDRVREATFNALGSLGAIEDARVIDLFAGTGALGIEALSRGAAHATFVERERAAVDVIERNLAAARLGGQATVVRADAVRYLDTAPACDVALIDPPYEFDGWATLLDRLDAGLAVVESDRAVEAPEPWEMVRSRRYGTTVVTIVRRTHDPSDMPDTPDTLG
jgi:16S rRNA (guanine966-N2)-methyltransferase